MGDDGEDFDVAGAFFQQGVAQDDAVGRDGPVDEDVLPVGHHVEAVDWEVLLLQELVDGVSQFGAEAVGFVVVLEEQMHGYVGKDHEGHRKQPQRKEREAFRARHEVRHDEDDGEFQKLPEGEVDDIVDDVVQYRLEFRVELRVEGELVVGQDGDGYYRVDGEHDDVPQPSTEEFVSYHGPFTCVVPVNVKVPVLDLADVDDEI